LLCEKVAMYSSTLPDRSSLSEQLFLLLIFSPPKFSSGQANSHIAVLSSEQRMSKLGGKRKNETKS
jgi:hypothetical protein